MGFRSLIMSLALVGLPQTGGLRFAFIKNDLACCLIHRVHGNSVRGAANHLAKVAALAPMYYDHSLHFLGIQHNRVCFRTVHDAETASLFGNTFIIIHKRNVIHSEFLLG